VKTWALRRASGPRRFCLAAIASATVLSLAVNATEALAYRPFDGTDADVTALGHFEIELGPVHWYSQGNGHFLIAPATVLNLGFAPRWELVADFDNFVSLDRQAGPPRDQLLDTDILAKAILVPGVLQDQGTGPSVALELGPLLPNVDAEGGFGASCNFIVSVRWHAITAHLNSWVELTRGELHPDWFEGVILEGDTHLAARPVSEWFVEREWITRAMTFSGLVGGIWHARDGLDFDAGLREASVGGQRAEEVRVGLTWEIGVSALRRPVDMR